MKTDVWFLVLPGTLALDMIGPAETLGLASDAFTLHYIGPEPEVSTSIGLTIGGIGPLPEHLPKKSLLVLSGVSDSTRYFDTPQAVEARRWLGRQLAAIQRGDIQLVCVCSGSLLAARSGLLHGVECTTHHDVITRLKAAEPGAIVREGRILLKIAASGPARVLPPASIYPCI